MPTKTIYLLNIDQYAPEITALTYPLIRFYAHKIGATIEEITERKFPDWPVVYEKLQIYERAKANRSDWHIYIDSDALVHPEAIDFTNVIGKDTILHHGCDMAAVRWVYDDYFRRDGRHFGSCNWFTIASDWCLDLWKPLDIPLAEAVARIYPTVNELNTVVTADHLIDDFTLSRNIARYGLKATTVIDLMKALFPIDAGFFWHSYTEPIAQKAASMKKVITENWKLPESILRRYAE